TNTKSNAMKLEYYIKKLTRNKKLSIIKNPSILINLIDNKEDYIIGKEIEQLT
ncbi:TPA: GIY-YIG nuclease family protein, partial [Clostridioides difficile]|nr:GIY-YIG nuclease family protein [Clostridioides difficile]